MESQHKELLEQQIAELSMWTDPDPQIWKRALEVTAPPRRGLRFFASHPATWSSPRFIAASIILVMISAVIAGLFFTSTGTIRDQAQVSLRSPAALLNRKGNFPGEVSPQIQAADSSTNGLGRTGRSSSPASMNGHYMAVPLASVETSNVTNWTHRDEETAAVRAVVRKATLEMICSDVRATFAKVLHVVSDAQDEFVQDSNLTGSGASAQANVTIRVAADRLSVVMNQLRELGQVNAERIEGEDVTTEVVDLESRLRNEQRVEMELLELLDKRTDAPLKEILELRENLNHIRQSIEQIVARRDRLGRMVSLATVLIIIRTDADQLEAQRIRSESIASYFGSATERAWRSGLLILVDTLAGAVQVLIGGLVWWVAIFAVLMIVRHHLRRRIDAVRL